MSELLREPKLKITTGIGNATGGISPVDAVRVVVNTAVAMSDHAPGIDVRSVEESSRGPGIMIWIPGYVHNGETVIVAAPTPSPTEAAP